MSFFQNKKRKATFSQNDPSPKHPCLQQSPAPPAPNNHQYLIISEITKHYNQKTDREIDSLKEVIESLKDQIKQLKADLSQMKRKILNVEEQAVPAYKSSYRKWEQTPSYIN